MTENNNKILSDAQLTIEMIGLRQRVSDLEQDLKELKPLQGDTIALKEQCKQILFTLNEVKEDVKDMKKSPANFLDKVVTALVSSVVGGIIVFMLNIFKG